MQNIKGDFSVTFFTKFILCACLAVIMGCGGSTQKEQAQTETSTTDTETQPQETAAANGVTKLVINGNDQMRFDKTTLRAKEGTRVELTLNHTGKIAKVAMGHNVVILKNGTDITAYAAKAGVASDNDFIAKDEEVIAHTKMIGGGESTTITFNAPPKGSYDFICSFPGHYAMMKGKFIVE